MNHKQAEIHADEITTLPILLIEAHSRCNCRCVMCDIWKSTDHRSLSVADLEAQLESFARLGTKWVVFTGGEPLMNPDIFVLSGMLRSRGIRITILSSGLLLERYAREIAEHVDDIIVSLDGPQSTHDQIRGLSGAYKQITTGIQALRLIDRDFHVTARCTVQKRNHSQLLQTVRDARAIGISSISFLAADLTSEAFNRSTPWNISRQSEIALNQTEIVMLDSQLDELRAERPFVIDSERHLGRISQHFRSHLGLASRESPRCNAPWVSALLGIDGSVKPCFFHSAVGMVMAGDERQPLQQIINQQSARQFRHNLDVATDPICQRCVCSLYRP